MTIVTLCLSLSVEMFRTFRCTRFRIRNANVDYLSTSLSGLLELRDIKMWGLCLRT